jgi:hypothetical protein
LNDSEIQTEPIQKDTNVDRSICDCIRRETKKNSSSLATFSSEDFKNDDNRREKKMSKEEDRLRNSIDRQSKVKRRCRFRFDKNEAKNMREETRSRANIHIWNRK